MAPKKVQKTAAMKSAMKATAFGALTLYSYIFVYINIYIYIYIYISIYVHISSQHVLQLFVR
jgi:hypothetical protein